MKVSFNKPNRSEVKYVKSDKGKATTEYNTLLTDLQATAYRIDLIKCIQKHIIVEMNCFHLI